MSKKLCILVAVVFLSVANANAQTVVIDQGTCGANLTWKLTSDSTLTISGSGDMQNYNRWQNVSIDSTTMPGYYIMVPSDTSDMPWWSHRNAIKTAVIGDSVTSIGNRAFWNCQSLISVTIPNSITTIGRSAFTNCDGLTSVTIPGSITTWENNVFDACDNLVTVIIKNGVTTIGESAFVSCINLTSVTIPNSVKSIEHCAFYICESLTSIILPDSLISIGSLAFGFCGLTSITIPNSVTTIYGNAFVKCSNLTSVTIGNSVDTIHQWAFDGCSGLRSITVHTINPPVIWGNQVFRNVPNTIPIYIPCETYNAYHTAWSYFSNFIEMKDTTFYTATICQGELYSDNNFTDLTETGYYYKTLQSVNGCDSVIELTVIVNPTYSTQISDNICKGATYDFNGKLLTKDGVYYDTLQTIFGCDSIIELILTVNPTYFVSDTIVICEGDSYDFYGKLLTKEGIYYDTFQITHGCNSIIELILIVNPTYFIQISDSICVGSSYNFNGKLLDKEGIYYDTLTTIYGCDSIIELTLRITSVGIPTITNYELRITVYPNPTNGLIMVEIAGLPRNDGVVIEIFDVYGKLVYTSPQPSPKERENSPSFGGGWGEVDISHLANGMYFIKINNNKLIKVVKN